MLSRFFILYTSWRHISGENTRAEWHTCLGGKYCYPSHFDLIISPDEEKSKSAPRLIVIKKIKINSPGFLLRLSLPNQKKIWCIDDRETPVDAVLGAANPGTRSAGDIGRRRLVQPLMMGAYLKKRTGGTKCIWGVSWCYWQSKNGKGCQRPAQKCACTVWTPPSKRSEKIYVRKYWIFNGQQFGAQKTMYRTLYFLALFSSFVSLSHWSISTGGGATRCEKRLEVVCMGGQLVWWVCPSACYGQELCKFHDATFYAKFYIIKCLANNISLLFVGTHTNIMSIGRRCIIVFGNFVCSHRKSYRRF